MNQPRKLHAAMAVSLTLTAILMLSPNLMSQVNNNRGRGLIGTWQVTVTQVDCQTGGPLATPVPPFKSLLTFADGGTMAEDTTNPAFGPGQRGAGQGIWSYKGRDRFDVRSVAFINYTTPANPAAHNPGFNAGEQTIVQTIALKQGSDTWSSVATIQFADTNQVVYRQGCAVAIAQRF